jgi:hypothetical protein
MNDSLTESVARLHRAGSEHSHQTKKLRSAADNLLTWLKQNLPSDFGLPCNCTLYPNGEFVRTELTNPPLGTSRTVFNISLGKEHSREELFRFSELIADGFLERLSERLETEATRFKKDAEQTASFLETVAPTPISLYHSSYRSDLEQLAREGKLPRDLVNCLKDLISSLDDHSVRPPEATPYLVREAKKYLHGGILMAYACGKNLYDVMVFVPDENQPIAERSFFKLVLKYKDGNLRHLKEL